MLAQREQKKKREFSTKEVDLEKDERGRQTSNGRTGFNLWKLLGRNMDLIRRAMTTFLLMAFNRRTKIGISFH
jgi:hypothetical protein